MPSADLQGSINLKYSSSSDSVYANTTLATGSQGPTKPETTNHEPWPCKENWNPSQASHRQSWFERLEFYFVANDINTMDKKRALLLTLCGPETYEVVRALVAPRRPGDVEFDELVTILGARFDPRPSELHSRFKFQRRDQLPEESISNYVAALKQLSNGCNFGILAPATTHIALVSTQHPASRKPVSS